MKKIIYIFVAAMITMLTACDKSENLTEKLLTPTNPDELYAKTEYNLDMRDFAMAVNEAISTNKSFRKLIKEEAMKKFDGDYDILLSKFVEKSVAHNDVDNGVNTPNRVKSNFTVRDLLDDAFFTLSEKSRITGASVQSAIKLSDSRQKAIATNQSVINSLVAEYPDLQISVPVHAEDLEDESYIAPVAFVPEEYEEGITEYVPVYDDGELTTIDAVTPPDSAVIVIGINERLLQLETEDLVPITPDLTATITESGIRLTWSPMQLDGTGYILYRKGTQDSEFIRIFTTYNSILRAYDDNSVVASRNYTYYVVAFNSSYESDPSNYVTLTAPAYPKPVISFDAIQNAKYEIELRWENDHSQFIQSTSLYKKVLGVDPDYGLIGQFTANDSYCFDRNITPGSRIYYKINHITNLGISNPKYDFVYASYRDISKSSAVYIKELSYTCDVDELEGWLKGAPEFQVTVFGTGPDKKTVQYGTIDNVDCLRFSNRDTKILSFPVGLKVIDWQANQWTDFLTFHVIERDNDGLKNIEITAKIGVKDTIAKVLNVEAGITGTFKLTDNPEDCGDAWIGYYEDPNKNIDFHRYGFKIKLSETE